MFKQFFVVASVAVLFSAMPASATIVQVLGQNYNLGGDSKWKEDSNGGTVNVVETSGFAGAYNIKIDGGATVQGFCIDLFLGLAVPGTYNQQNIVMPTSNTLSDMTRVSRAAWIFSDVFPNIAALATANSTTRQTIAVALQFAMWEVMVDSSFSLSGGYFQKATSNIPSQAATNVDYTKATNLATTWGTSTYAGTVNTAVANRSIILVDTGYTGAVGSAPQRLISYRGDVVPEPGTMALFGSALAALGLAARRRKI